MEVPQSDLPARIKAVYRSCSREEQAVLRTILQELATTGHSTTYEQVWLADYKEIPVDKKTFLTSPYYLGGTNNNGASIYPAWMDVMMELERTGNQYTEIVFTGATRTGKTSTAVSDACYQLYRLMCLRDPQAYFGLKSTTNISIFFFNLTQTLAKSVAFKEFNTTISGCNWFLDHGHMSASESNPTYIPEGGKIEVTYGSDASHAIGKATYCLVGETEISTIHGNIQIKNIHGRVTLPQLAPKGNLIYVDAHVRKTKEVTTTIRLTLSNGTIIEGTKNHKLMVADRTYKTLNSIKVYDKLNYISYHDDTIIVIKKETVHYKQPIPVYDVINANPHNNFFIPSSDGFIVSHNCVIFDECNFAAAGIKDINKAKKRMKEKYDTLVARVTGTFVRHGEVYGKLYIISSKNSDSDFMEDYIAAQKQANNPHMYIFDKPQWEVWPKSKYSSDKMFKIALGGRNLRSFVIPDNQMNEESYQEFIKQGYKLMDVPEDNKTRFLADFDIALRDIAGVSIPGTLSFITQESLNGCITQARKNPFYTDIISVGTKDTLTIEEFFHIEEVPEHIRRMPMFIHLDLSLNTDKTGISGVCISGRRDIDIDGKKISMPTFEHVFTVSIEAPRGANIPYSKITAFICWLRKNGFNIQGISRDQFQSEYMGQILEEQGFNVKKLSLDRTPEGYMTLRTIIVEKRISMLHVQLLEDELIKLQRDSATGKCDHLPGGCFTGDTKIRLVDGRSLTILELMEEQDYRTNWVYTINESTKQVEPKRIQSVHQTKLTSNLVKVTLDNGCVITCTPDHLFMVRDGHYEQIQNLHPGDSLMPLYTKVATSGLEGYRLYYDPVPNKWHYEHRMFCKNATLDKGWVIHHNNYNKLDNCPTNLRNLTSSEHATLHNNTSMDYTKSGEGVRKWHERNKHTEMYRVRNKKLSESTSARYRMNRTHTMLRIKKLLRIVGIEKAFGVAWSELDSTERSRYSRKFTFLCDPDAIARMIAKRSLDSETNRRRAVSESTKHMIWVTNGVDSKYIRDTSVIPEGYYKGRTLARSYSTWDRMSEEAKARYKQKHSEYTSSLMWVTNGVEDRYIKRTDSIPEGFRNGRSQYHRNHKIISIEHIHKPCRVYDLTIEDNHNFALDAGVFVHNSKDASDSFAGAVWNAVLTNPSVPISSTSLANAIAGVNGSRFSNSSGFDMFPGIRRYN